MAWTDSRVFTQSVNTPLAQAVSGAALPTGFTSFTTANSLFAALFGTGVTPDRNAVVGSTGYNTGTWLLANESTATTGYTAGGSALPATLQWTIGTSSVGFFAGNLAWTVTGTLTAFGDLVYQNNVTAGTVAKQGVCFNYFGGSQSVTGGTFTIAWNAAGVFNFAT